MAPRQVFREITPQGAADLKPGANEVSFTCTPPEGGINARANVVVGMGEVVGE